MKRIHLPAWLSERFSLKVFLAVTSLIIIISVSFTVFDYRSQQMTFARDLRSRGKVIVKLLAYSSRLAVFSENKFMINEAIQGTLAQQDVVSVSIFRADGTILKRETGSTPSPPASQQSEEGSKLLQNIPGGIIERINNASSPLVMNNPENISLWAPVLSRASYFEDPLLQQTGNKANSPPSRVIGFVCLTMSKAAIQRKASSLLFKHMFIALLLTLLAVFFSSMAVTSVTRPLQSLTTAVTSFGMGKPVERVRVETTDEIGKLAAAFNRMAVSLSKRDAEKKRLEEQLRHAQKMEAVGVLTSGIAHNFNTVLTIIRYNERLIQMSANGNEELSRYVTAISEAVDRGAQSVESLMAFSRKQKVNPMPTDLNKIVQEMKTFLTPVLGSSIKVICEIHDHPVLANVDTGPIEHALINLATNARDAMPEGGVLRIKLELAELDARFLNKDIPGEPDLYAVLSVSDTGVGMPEEMIERIFDPFYTTKEVGKGTGLGLSVAYGIIEQHNGHIWADSLPGEGTTFRIYLPVLKKSTGSIS